MNEAVRSVHKVSCTVLEELLLPKPATLAGPASSFHHAQSRETVRSPHEC